jgi:hypothetical protein
MLSSIGASGMQILLLALVTQKYLNKKLVEL